MHARAIRPSPAPPRRRQKSDFTKGKETVRASRAALDAAGPEALAPVMAAHTAPAHLWRGDRPFNEIAGAEAVAETFWHPQKASLAPLQRRDDIFFAGANEIDGFACTSVVSMGHLMGLLDAPWLSIPATGKMAFLRLFRFDRVEGGKVVETATSVDIPHLMMQAGLAPFPPQTAARLVRPGPMTPAGCSSAPSPPTKARRALRSSAR